MCDENKIVEKISKKEINRYVDDKTYKPDVNMRQPKQAPYKRKKNWSYEEVEEDY